MGYVDEIIIISKYEEIMESQKWREAIPFIQFPSDWKVKIIPPFAGAVIRFQVLLPGMKEEERISIYLDCYSRLGMSSTPYWEVYPYKGDTGRCGMYDVKKLLEMISDRLSD